MDEKMLSTERPRPQKLGTRAERRLSGLKSRLDERAQRIARDKTRAQLETAKSPVGTEPVESAFLQRLGKRAPDFARFGVTASVLLNITLAACSEARERNISVAEPPVDQFPSAVVSLGEPIPSPVPHPISSEAIMAEPLQGESFAQPSPHPSPEGLIRFLPSQRGETVIYDSVVWTREPKYGGEMALWTLFGTSDIQSSGHSWDVIGYAPVGKNPPKGLVQAVAFSIDGEMIGESVGAPKEIDMTRQSEGMVIDLESYQIQEGDRLNDILLSRGASENSLPEWISRVCKINHLSNPDEIREGNTLWIPTNVPVSQSEYGVGGPDYSLAIALGFQGYTVLPGDTPESVANLYGISPETLLVVNGIKDVNEYWLTGENLFIPNFDLENSSYSPAVLSLSETYVYPSEADRDSLAIIKERYPLVETSIIQRAELVRRYFEAGVPPISPYSIIWRDYKIFQHNGGGELPPTQENIERVLARYMLAYELNPVVCETLVKLRPGIRAINRFLESSPYWDGPPIPEELEGRNIFYVGEDFSYGTEGFPEITGNWEEILKDPFKNRAVIEGYLFYIIPHELEHSWVETESEASSLPPSWGVFKHNALSIGVGISRKAMGLEFDESIGFMELDPRVVLVYSRLREAGVDAFPLLRDIMVVGDSHPELIREVVDLYEQNQRGDDPPFDEMFANFGDIGRAHTIVTEEEKSRFIVEFDAFVGR